MRRLALHFVFLQGVIVLALSAVGGLMFGWPTGASLAVGGLCAGLGSLTYAALQRRGVTDRAAAALRDHLLGQLTKWLVAGAALYAVMRSGSEHSPAALTLGFVVAMLAHALVLPWLKSR